MKIGYLVQFFTIIFLTGCATIHYRSSGRIPLHVFKEESSKRRELVVRTGQKDFYLWGLYPKESTVLIDEELKGKESVTFFESIRIHEYRSLKNLFFSIFTLGMYVPTNYRIVGVGDFRRSRFKRKMKWD